MTFDSVFGSVPAEKEIFVPFPDPFPVRNNCQLGRWTINGEEYSGTQWISVVGFRRFFGDLGMTQNTSWGQLWFVVESGSLPKGIVSCTYLKTQSLRSFVSLVIKVKASRSQPEEGIFEANFVKSQGQAIDSMGSSVPCSYYFLDWKWDKERTEDYYSIDQLKAAAESDLFDQDGTRNLVSITGDRKQREATIACFLQEKSDREISALAAGDRSAITVY